MSALTALKKGARIVYRNKKIGFIFLSINLAFALVVILPVISVMSIMLGNSLYAESLFKELDVQWISEFLYKYPYMPLVMLPILATAMLSYLIFNTCLIGGALEVFNSEHPTFSTANFLNGCRRYFPRLLRLFLFSLLFYAIVLLINTGLGRLSNKLLQDNTVEKFAAWLEWSRMAIILFLLGLVNMIFDYAKIKAVVDDSKKAARETFRSITFIAHNLAVTLKLYFTLALSGVVILAMYNLVESALPKNSAPILLLIFLLQQSFILAKIWVRLAFFSSQMIFYKDLQPITVPTVEQVRAIVETSPEPPLERPLEFRESAASESTPSGEERKDERSADEKSI